MNTIDKIRLFLSFKLNLEIFNRFEADFAKKLSNSIVHSQNEVQKVMYEFLCFERFATASNIKENIRVLLHVYKHGQLRTLLQITNPFSWSDNSYQLSRLNLYGVIMRNFKLFRLNFLNKLSLTYLNNTSYLSNRVYPASQMHNAALIGEFQMLDAFVMENVFTAPYKIKLPERFNKDVSPVDDFISWNSYFFILFLRKHGLDDSFRTFLQERFPMIFESVNKFRILEVLHHEMSDHNLDSILMEKGLNFSVSISNAEIWHQRFILSEDRLINFDATASPGLSYVAGVWPYIWKAVSTNSTCAVLVPNGNPLHLSDAIFLMGRVDENWYHFLLDTLPRLVFLEKLPSHFPVLVRRDLPETTKEFLRKITSRTVIEVDTSEIVNVRNLHILPGRSTVYDSHPPEGKSLIEFSPLVIKLMRDEVLKALSLNGSRNPERKISFNRMSVKRNVVNWKKISQELASFSFQDTQLDEDFFKKQVEVFHGSSFVVSPGGAVLSNIIFMKPESRVLALRSFRGRENNLWRELSHACGLRYFEVKGVPTFWGFSYLRKLHSNFYISPRKLRRILSLEI